ncbi:MAG: asparagine synthase (glutamine-hydrolyzing), partial [Bdellovibrionota bacterium]
KGLLDLGVAFTTKSDTEVLLQTILTDGPRTGLLKLNGMFAFAVWSKDSLLLGRDRVGIKPLYYSELPDGGLVFGSELSTLLAHPAVNKQIDPEALAEFFFLDYSQAPNSLLRGVKKLEPGCFLTWKNGKLSTPERYWQLGFKAEMPKKTGAELSSELWERLGQAVERQLVADVPVGVLLSGGLDSSAIAALAAKKTREPLRTFSIGFTDPSYDETSYARLMAEKIGSVHTEQCFGEAALLEGLEKNLAQLDEPMADPSLLPTSLLAELAAKHVKVALGGDGGDELWAGYPTYKAHHYARMYGALPSFLRKGLIPWAVEQLPVQSGYQAFDWKAKRFTGRWDDDSRQRHLRWMSSSDSSELENISSLRGFQPGILRQESQVNNFSDQLNGLLALDFTTYLPGSVLSKVDRASMAHGLEVRPPFLDAEFVDWSFSLPSSLKLHGGQGKFLLKAAAERHLPAEIIHRRKKGFGIPLAAWLRGPLATVIDSVLIDSPLWDFLHQETFYAWHKEHLALQQDRSKPLWAMLVLDRWVKRFGCHS